MYVWGQEKYLTSNKFLSISCMYHSINLFKKNGHIIILQISWDGLYSIFEEFDLVSRFGIIWMDFVQADPCKQLWFSSIITTVSHIF